MPHLKSSSGAWARMIGEDGRGIRTIIEMVSHTRLDCAIGSSAGMRTGVAQATHHAMNRSAFGKADRPAADGERAGRPLCLSPRPQPQRSCVWPGHTTRPRPVTKVPLSFSARPPGPQVLDLCAPPWHAVESLECFGGGNGYAEESGMPRLFRRAR